MKKVLGISLLSVSLVSFLFTGCATSSNLTVEQKKLRTNIAVYVDDSAINKKETEVLKNIKSVSSQLVFVKYKTKSSAKESDSVKANEFVAIENIDKNALLIENYSNDKAKHHLENTDYDKFRKEVKKINFKIVDNQLVSEKSYLNSTNAFTDYVNLASDVSFHSMYGGIYSKSSAFDIIVLDGKALLDKKLVVKPLSEVLSFKEKTEQVLKKYGYKVVNDINKADKVITLKYNALTHLKALKNMKSAAKLKGTTKNLPIGLGSMEIAKHYGASSSSSSALGLGMFVLGEMLDSSRKDKAKKIKENSPLAYSLNAKILDKKSNDISELNLEYKMPYSIMELVSSYNQPLSNDNFFGSSADSIVFFMERGVSKDDGDIVIKAPSNPKSLIINM